MLPEWIISGGTSAVGAVHGGAYPSEICGRVVSAQRGWPSSLVSPSPSHWSLTRY